MPIPLADIIKKQPLGKYDVMFLAPGAEKEQRYMDCSSFEEATREYWRLMKGKDNTAEYGRIRVIHLESGNEVSKDDLIEFYENSNLVQFFAKSNQ